MSGPSASGGLHVEGLEAERLVDPLGLDVARPRLSWRLRSDRRGARQVSARVRVTGDVAWDSGELPGDRSVDVPLGVDLPPEARCRWSVEVRDDGGAVARSAEARLERMPQEPAGRWICLPRPTDAHDAHRPAVHVRTVVQLPEAAVAARLHVTAAGLVQPWLDGERVGDDELAPGWTDFRQRVRCRSFDVTDRLGAGRHALGAVVADGWYAGRVGWEGREHYGRTPVVRMELVVDLPDGSRRRTSTDETWRASYGPVRAGDLLDGEAFDERDALPGWATAAYDDSGWRLAWPDPGPGGRVVASVGPPVRRVREVAAVSVRPGRPGSWVADLGETVYGRPRVVVEGEPGRVVRLRCAESLEADGALRTANLRSARCTDEVVLAGGRLEHEPWTTARGFRWVEVTGAEPLQVGAGVLGNDVRDTGSFSCSDPALERLWEVVERTVRAVTVGLPVDCPQRDERLGWLADADAVLPVASYLQDLHAFWAAWLQEVRGAQSAEGAFPDVAPRVVHLADGAPGWGDAGVSVPWQLWRWSGDRQVLEEAAGPAAAWVRWVAAANPDGRWRERRGLDHGDWLAPGGGTDRDVVAQAHLARSAALAARVHELLGRPSAELTGLAALARRRFLELVASDGRVGDGSQTAQLLALAFDLLPAERRPAAQAVLVADVERHGLRTGFLGTRHLLPQLTAAGRTDLAYRLVQAVEPPSWGHMIGSGASTLWERWDAWTAQDGWYDPFLSSLCHASHGSVATWLHETVGGLALDPAVPGWRSAVVRPRPGGGLVHGATSYASRHGDWAVAWELDGDLLRAQVQVPVGCSALVDLPGTPVDDGGGERGPDGVRVVAGRWSLSSRQETAPP